MTIKHKNEAEDACERSNYGEAGRLYTLAAYDSLSKCDFPDPESVTTGTYIGLAIYCFQNAAFAFHLAGDKTRCENRVEQAILIIKDFEEYTFRYDALRGLAREAIGDLQLVRGNETAAADEYEIASDRYMTVTETGWLAESIFEWSFEFFREIMDDAGDPVSVEKQTSMLTSFDERIKTKREKLPDGIETVTETGNYTPGS